MSWPPTAAEFYLKLGEHTRPAFQGDVYQDVLFTKAKAGDLPTSDPKPVEEHRVVAALSHPCDMFTPDGAKMSKCQAVVAVRDGTKSRVRDDWIGSVTLCPLPDLMGDGKLWVADFTLVSNVDQSFLTGERRVRCLSELGWGIFRQRATTALTRVEFSHETFMKWGHPLWVESMLEMEWLAGGRDQRSFQTWLNDSDPARCPDVEKRRELLSIENGIERVEEMLRAELDETDDAPPARAPTAPSNTGQDGAAAPTTASDAASEPASAD